MFGFIAILILFAAAIVYIKYFVLQKSSARKAFYRTAIVIGTVLLLLFLSKFCSFIFKNYFTTILCAAPLVVLMFYCERFFVIKGGKDKKLIPQTQHQLQSAVQTLQPPKTQDQLEYDQWRAENVRRKALHKTVHQNEIQAVIAELTEKTKRPAIWIEPIDADNLPLLTSKYGGLPYIPKDELPPCDSEGRQLRLLAQLNLCELPSTDFMPKEGVLQFWALNDRMVGFAPYHSNVNLTYQVIYHEKIDVGVTTAQVLQKYHPWYEEGLEDHFPINHEFALKFTVAEEGMESDDSRWDKLFAELWNQKHPEMEVYSIEDLPGAMAVSEYCSNDVKNKIGGYPNFVQWDRHGEEDVLLLQIPSTGQQQRRIMWGDCGIANFFIKEEALAMHDFSDAMYHWDCY